MHILESLKPLSVKYDSDEDDDEVEDGDDDECQVTTILIRGVVGVGAVIREDAVPALNVSWDQHTMMMINYPP